MFSFAYGRKGAKLTVGSKPDYPVAEEEARAIFDKIVKEKTSKGYVPYEVARPKWLDVAPAPVEPNIQRPFCPSLRSQTIEEPWNQTQRVLR